MKKSKRIGRLWFRFTLFGLDWETRVAPEKDVTNREGHSCQAICYLDKRWILFSADQTPEQFRITLAHELQHAIEDHADVDYEQGTTEDVHDRWTDQVARGWVYLIRHNPEIIDFLRDAPSPLRRWARKK